MGILDGILKKTIQICEGKMNEKMDDVFGIADDFRDATSAFLNAAGVGEDSVWNRETDSRSFDEKLTKVVKETGDYEIRRKVTLRELEQEFGEDIYVHGRSHCYCEPDDISYGIYQNGRRVLLIRLWNDYGQYNHAANREVWGYCRDHQVKILDFYDYLPNEEGYMTDRIRKELAD